MTTSSYVSDTVGRKSCSSCSIKQELIHPATIWRRVESGVRLTRGIAVRKRANGTTGTFSYERGWYSASLTTSPRRESCQFRSDPRVRVPETPAPRSRPPSRRPSLPSRLVSITPEFMKCSFMAIFFEPYEILVPRNRKLGLQVQSTSDASRPCPSSYRLRFQSLDF